ncbi:hypothetical protein OF83DRAFT_1295445 [Amylostereum chailletii]|nr:hypothetical protein OF83DRAFT_1295445 [Amylostereum chailletii]
MAPLPSEQILQEKFELEFSPPLDTVLIAALVVDLYMETPTQHQIDELHATLTLLAAQADQQAEYDEKTLVGAFEDVAADDNSSSAPGDSSLASEAVSTSYATTVNGSPQSQTSSVESFSSPLGFLQTAFPHVPSSVLRRALEECGDAFDDPEKIDILPVLEDLLSQEMIKEEQEREEAGERPASPPQAWFVVPQKQKKRKAKGKTIALNDIRQQHQVRAGPMSPSALPVDTWTAVSSLSSRLATLLPSHPESYFASFFHSPSTPTPASAVRAALSSIPPASPLDADLLATIREILRSAPEFDAFDAEERSTLLSDAALCLRACDADADAALDLVWLLRNLDEDEAGEWAMGPYHQQQAPLTPSAQRKLPDGPPEPVLPKAVQARKPTTPSLAPAPPPNAWKVIPQKKPANGANPHAAFIPAYGGARKGPVLPAISTSIKTAPAETKDAYKQRRRLQDLQARRAEALMAAGRAWQQRGAKNHGGEVALYYAEQARQLREEERKAALDDARMRVETKRKTSPSGTTIDLHWTTVTEAVALAKEALDDCGSSPAKPLKIITGRGNHSHQGKGVLLPAIKAALVQEGWNVSTFDAGLVRRSHRNKRKKTNAGAAVPAKREPSPPALPPAAPFTLQPLHDALASRYAPEEREDGTFDARADALAPEWLRAREEWARTVERDDVGRPVALLSPLQEARYIEELETKEKGGAALSVLEALLLRKLKLQRHRRLHNVPSPALRAPPPSTLTPWVRPTTAPPPDPAVLAALHSIRTTPYAHSLAARIRGFHDRPPAVVAADWEARAPWMELMQDVRLHRAIKCPDEALPDEEPAPITYVTLAEEHLPQVHDILRRSFWEGIDVRDSLQYGPQQATILATHKRLVVGCAFLSSPQETYITYLAVRAGWENAQIATTMLYHLITRNPGKDISLHVSANNPAMLLYNRFGFKAEEFVVDFYNDYLDPHSRASKNAFRLRLRR